MKSNLVKETTRDKSFMGKSLLLLVIVGQVALSQVKPKVTLVGGDNVPAIKRQIENVLEDLLLGVNRIKKGTGSVAPLKEYFTEDAFRIFERFVLQNGAYTARKTYSPQMIERQRGFDIRSIAMKVNLGETEASDVQNLVFSFSKEGKIVSVRAIIPNQDYESVIATGTNAIDSLMRGNISDFLERFRIAYNAKDLDFLEKVYSDDALIIVGSVLKKKETPDDYMKSSFLSRDKVKLIQLTKRQYLDGLKEKAFKTNSFINVRFDSLSIIRHEKIPYIYGLTCWQQWNSSTYSDRGFLFLMMDFRQPDTPMIHVRSWQPQPFDDGSYVGLYDFDVVEYK